MGTARLTAASLVFRDTKARCREWMGLAGGKAGIFGLRGSTIESDAVLEPAERGQAATNRTESPDPTSLACNGPTVCTDKSN